MTPVEELFQLLWDTPQDKLTWFAIKKRMLEKEKDAIINTYNHAYEEGWESNSWKPEEYYNETFNTK